MIGFDTIGNATIICYDGDPILVTDPWIAGSPYFGSWTLSHEIPEEQREAIRTSRHVWFSHGHPDHLNADSLALLTHAHVLLPDHIGGRIQRDLKDQGIKVTVLPDRRWTSLSPRIRVMCISDFNQDAVILIDVNGTLLVNTNDAMDNGWGRLVRETVRQFDRSFLLKLSGYGDADMCNFFDENGRRIPTRAHLKLPPAPNTEAHARAYGISRFIPFSSFHRYQREDSIWANEIATPIDAYAQGATGDIEFLPPFVRYDAERDIVTEINPPQTPEQVLPATAFGDNWSEQLERDERDKLKAYFKRKAALNREFGFLRFIVGGQETIVDFNPARGNVGITFEAPRKSLMDAVTYEVFDDLLIGNFMKTTLHGIDLYPHFTPYVTKYGDNGLANSEAELRRYFSQYIARSPVDVGLLLLRREAETRFRSWAGENTLTFKLSKRAYHFMRGLRSAKGDAPKSQLKSTA